MSANEVADPHTWLSRNRIKVPDRTPFLVSGQTTVTYGAIDDHTARLASLLDELDIAPGAPIMVISNEANAIGQLSLGVIRSGRCLSVVDPAGTAREIRAALVVVEPVLIFAAGDVIERCELRKDCVWTVIELGRRTGKSLADRLFAKRKPAEAPTTWPELVDARSPVGSLPALDPEATALIVFTSGSTSRPKGVELSLRAILTHFETLTRVFDLQGAVLHNVLPLSHVDGLIQGPLMAYFNAATWVRPAEFTVAKIPELLDAIYRERVTHLIVVPTMLALYDRLASDMTDAFDTPDFKMIMSSAGPLPAALWERFETTFGATICNSYGLSETVTSSIAAGPVGSDTRRVGSIGKPIDCQVELLDESGEPVSPGEVGEIVITGDHLFSRYRNDEEATNAVLNDRTFHTGDLAVWTEDGFIELHGRKGSMIIRGGRNISPVEIDEIVGRLTGVVQSATVGLDDPMWGQRVETAVVADDTITNEDVLEHCRRELAAHKVPQRVERMSALPLTGTGKVDTRAIRAALEDRTQATSSAGDIDAVVLDLAARTFGVSPKQLTASSSIDHTDGWDSLAHLDLVGALEDHFRCEMTNADILGIRTLADAAEVVRTRRS